MVSRVSGASDRDSSTADRIFSEGQLVNDDGEDQPVGKGLTDSATVAITCSATRTSSPSAWHPLPI